MKIEQLQKHKKILIAGYGKEGQSVERFLRANCPEVFIGVADMQDGPDYLDKQDEYDLVIKSPGINKKYITAPHTTATNIFFANCPGMIIGVTGSKGKSTTASLIHDILKAGGKQIKLVGNIGNPMLDSLLEPLHPATIFVCELSSYQLDDIQYSPHISVIVSLFPEHMNYHGSVESYYEAKHNIINNVKPDDYFVYNPQFPLLEDWASRSRCRSIPFTESMPDYIQDIPLIGEHNRDNIRGAITVAELLAINHESIAKAVANFQPLRHRLQTVGTFQGITFIDDAISTSPESTIAALNSVGPVGTIFLGGENRGYDFSSLIPYLVKLNIPNIVYFPESGKDIEALVAKEKEYHPHTFSTSDMKEAVQFAYEHTPKGTIALLSTASPSYTVWKNFEVKGDLFQKYVIEEGRD